MEIISAIAGIAALVILFELTIHRAWKTWRKHHPPLPISSPCYDDVDDNTIIVLFADWLEYDFKKIMLQRRFPNTSDLPFPAEKIERALNRILIDQKTNQNIKNAATWNLQLLDAIRFETWRVIDKKTKSSPS